MSRWWARPLVRLVAAGALPLVVPLVITFLIWALPGDPASIICPPERCPGTEALARRWNLDQGPFGFFTTWVASAAVGDFGPSWRVLQGSEISTLLREAIPQTLGLFAVASGILVGSSVVGAARIVPRALNGALVAVGLIPGVVWALVATAMVEIRYGAASLSGEASVVRLLVGALVLGVADSAMSGAIGGTREIFDTEMKRRYVRVGVLRGEGVLANTLPNVLPTVVGQLRARVVHLLSALVIVEVILRIEGIGNLLWRGTLLQDFGLVLAVATVFAAISGGLLAVQALVEVLVALYQRRYPLGVA